MSGTEDGVGQQQAAPTSSQFAQLMAAIQGVQTKVDQRFAKLKRERESADEQLVKRMRLDKKPVFKKVAHEKQYEFNKQVYNKMEQATAALEQATPAVQKAKDILKEGEKLIASRQKNIKIADRSEHGWVTVNEYEEDELADNSDDEKRLFRAENRAARKVKHKNSAKQTKKNYPLRKTGVFHNIGWSALRTESPHTHNYAMQYQGQGGPSQWQVPKPNTVYGSSQPGPCYMCGRLGHFRKNCPLLIGAYSGPKSTQ